MSFDYNFTFSAVEIAVRYGDDNINNNDMISCYVHLGLERAKSLSDIALVRSAHMRIVDTLIDTMCDPCLSAKWRNQCYRQIKRLLPLLHEMLSPPEYKNKIKEINILHAYFYTDSQVT